MWLPPFLAKPANAPQEHALHYNHNANRETARRSDGTEKYCVRYPRFRKGAHVVRPIKEAASYGKQCQAVLSYFEMAHE